MNRPIAASILALALAGCGGGGQPAPGATDAAAAPADNGAGAAPLPSGATMRPGRWESKVSIDTVELPDLPESIRAQAEEQVKRQAAAQGSLPTCVTAEQAKDMESSFRRMQGGGSCKFDRLALSNGTISGDMTCNAQGMTQKLSMHGSYGADYFKITTEATGGAGPNSRISQTTETRRIGECKGDEVDASKSGRPPEAK